MQSESIGTYRGVVIYLDWQSEGEPPFVHHFCTYRSTVQGEELSGESLAAIHASIDRVLRGNRPKD